MHNLELSKSIFVGRAGIVKMISIRKPDKDFYVNYSGFHCLNISQTGEAR
jgi:hypothetical protein